MTQNRPIRILFVCVGNACRSPMAEAFARHLAQERAEIWSAGISHLGSILPDTRAAMAERGISLDGQRSKGIDEVPLAEMDVVVRMGREVQFALPDEFRGRLVEWQIPDPYSRGLSFFLHVRDLIEAEVRALLAKAGNVSTRNLSEKERSEDGGDGGRGA